MAKLKLKSSKSINTNIENTPASLFLESLLGPLTFGLFIKACRTSKDMNQKEMADFLGISKSTLCDIEKGRQLVSPALAAKFAKKCRMSEVVAVQAALSDQLRKAKIKMKIVVVKDDVKSAA